MEKTINIKAPSNKAEAMDRLRGVVFAKIGPHSRDIIAGRSHMIIFDGVHPETGERVHVVAGTLPAVMWRNALVMGICERDETVRLLKKEESNV